MSKISGVPKKKFTKAPLPSKRSTQSYSGSPTDTVKKGPPVMKKGK